MKNSIGSWRKIRRTLCNKLENEESFFPKCIHCKHFMCSISVQKECLAEKRQVPVGEEEY
jgi:hypothetical protein